MFGKKSQLEVLLEAYKVGGVPLTLLLLGAALLIGGIADAFTDVVKYAQPAELLAVAIALIVLSAATWIVRQIMVNRVQLSLLRVIEEIARGAAQTSKTGGDFQSAIRVVTDNMGNLLGLLKPEEEPEKS